MSSNIRVKKICQHCKQSFIAQKTVTKFCSLTCAQRNYKKRKKEEKITQVILQTNDQLLNQSASVIAQGLTSRSDDQSKKDWIKVEDVAELIGIGERTVFRLIKDKAFPKLKIGRRLLFNKQQILNYFISKSEEL